MTLGPALKMTGFGGALYIVAMFYVFFSLSCIILIIMEGVSAMVSSLKPFPCPAPTQRHLLIVVFSTAPLAASRMGRVLLKVRRVRWLAVCAVLVQADNRGVGGVDRVHGIIDPVSFFFY